MTGVKTILMTFPRKKGAPPLEERVPEFDWDAFKKLPLAREYVRKKYEETLRKLVVEIDSCKNGTSRNHLKSIAAVLAREHVAKREEIADWLDARDWSILDGQHPHPKTAEKTIRSYAMGIQANSDTSYLPLDQRRKMADLVALLADKSEDVMADWLFEKFANDGSESISEL